MKRVLMYRTVLFFVVMTVFCIGIQQVQATTIDSTGGNANPYFEYHSPFGSPYTATYGQTFTVPTIDNILNSFSMYLHSSAWVSGELDFRGYIAEWNGNRATAILYESDTRTMYGGVDLQEFSFSTGGLNLVSGGQYVAFLSTSNVGTQTPLSFLMPWVADTIEGGFVFMNNLVFSELTNYNWESFYQNMGDVWFKAEFVSVGVPEPASLLLFGSGLAGLLAGRRMLKL